MKFLEVDDDDDDFKVVVRATATGNITRKLADIVDYKLQAIASTEPGQALLLQVVSYSHCQIYFKS